MGLSPLGCASLSSCPWAWEVAEWLGFHRAATWGANHGGCPYADGQTCPWLSANKFSLFWLLPPVSHLPHVPWPQTPWFGGFGKKPATQRAQNTLWKPESNPFHLSFPVCFFSRKLGQTLFPVIFVGVERLCLFKFLLFCFLRSDYWAPQRITMVLDSWYK